MVTHQFFVTTDDDTRQRVDVLHWTAAEGRSGAIVAVLEPGTLPVGIITWVRIGQLTIDGYAFDVSDVPAVR